MVVVLSVGRSTSIVPVGMLIKEGRIISRRNSTAVGYILYTASLTDHAICRVAVRASIPSIKVVSSGSAAYSMLDRKRVAVRTALCPNVSMSIPTCREGCMAMAMCDLQWLMEMFSVSM